MLEKLKLFLFPELKEIFREEYSKGFNYNIENPAENLVRRLGKYVSFRENHRSAAYLYEGNILSVNSHLDIFQWYPNNSPNGSVRVRLEYPFVMRVSLIPIRIILLKEGLKPVFDQNGINNLEKLLIFLRNHKDRIKTAKIIFFVPCLF